MLHEGGIPISNAGGDAMPSDAEVDGLLSGKSSGDERIPMESPNQDHALDADISQGEQPAAEATETPAVDPIVSKLQQAISQLTPEQRAALVPSQPIEVTFNGQKMQIAPDKQPALIQMGLNYSERMRALNTEKQAFETEKTKVSSMEKYYGDIDRVAKENPGWWEHVKASYQKFQGRAGNTEGYQANSETSDAEMTPALRQALSKVTDLERKLEGFLENQTKEITTKQQQAEDAALDQQISKVKSEYSDFDWMTADESGLVLEDRIIAHAHKEGINNFRAAARDYLHDQLIKRHSFKAKEDVKKAIQTKTKSGEVIKSQPQKNLKPAQNYQNKSYEELFNEGIAELG